MTSWMLLLSLSAHAEVPLPLYPECGEPDRPDLCPSDLGERWNLISYVPQDWRDTVRSQEHDLGTGLWADRAWRTTTGRPDVVIAVLDSGIKWDNTDVLNKHFLNAAELPLPQDLDGVDAADHDANGDGVFNIQDWADDPRVDPTAGDDVADHLLDPSDLIATFSDGIDDDGNGYVDDISGWDFFWNDNNPYDDTRYGHGTGEMEDSTAEGNDAGSDIGTCPSCMAVSLRVGDSFVADSHNFATATLYAVDIGASVVQEALGTLNDSPHVRAAIDHAWDNGVLVVASAADEIAYHHNMPGANHHTLYVHANRYDDDDRDESETFLAYSNCTNHGVRLVLSAPSTSCSSGAVGVTSGVAGLVYSAAADAGVTLTAGEAYQLLAMTADDIDQSGDPVFDVDFPKWYPSGPGWDRFFGYGRVNAARAVEAVAAGEIPPEADITGPDWFAVIDPTRDPELVIEGLARADRSDGLTWVLEWGAGDQPDSFTEISSGAGGADGVLGTLDLSSIPASALDAAAPIPEWTTEHDQVAREIEVHRFTLTLRLRVEDADGLVGEMRKAVFLRTDPDLAEGFPLQLGGSLESSVNLVDLDGDGVREIVIGDGAGSVHALRGDGTELDGWPVRTELLEETDPNHAGQHLDGAAYAGLDADVRASVVASVAVGDLDGDGQVEVVAADMRGGLYVWSASGELRDGFPVHHAPPAVATTPDVVLDQGFFSSPALGDLDGDGDLEIVIGGMDHFVYAWNDDGSVVDGWPVSPVFPGYEQFGARIIASPALGDLDGDGAVDVVIGTNETLNGTYGAVYAIHGAGTAHPDGAVMPGWPVAVFGAYTQALPYVGEGLPNSPALADIDGDGDLEIAAHTIAGEVVVFHHDGSEIFSTPITADHYGEGSNVYDAAGFPFINSTSFGDLNGDGSPDLVTGALGSGFAESQLYDGRRARVDFPLMAWSGTDGEPLPGWPRQMEDLQFFMNPAIADVDGDGGLEVINGSGGYLVHAFGVEGTEPAGWPKFTGNWLLGSPAVGDVDGDGLLEVVIGTRMGWLYVWDTPAPADGAVAWQSFGHDPANTGNHESPLPGFNAMDATPVVQTSCGCVRGSNAALAGVWMLGLGALARRRRRG